MWLPLNGRGGILLNVWSRGFKKTARWVWLGVVLLFAPALCLGVDIPGSQNSWVWMDSEGKPLPFGSDEEILDFLQTASIVDVERVGEGVNNPFKVLLERDGVRANACFRDVRVFKKKVRLEDGLHFNFRDDAIFEVAAYRLARLLGLNNVPPVVERNWIRRNGTLQIWLENAVSEKKRLQTNTKPSNPRRWGHEYQMMLVFDALIANKDRNQGNILFDSGWNRWLIDHTRSFRTNSDPGNIGAFKLCDATLWEGLTGLSQETLAEHLGDLLSTWQIEAILQRRDRIVEHFEDRIETWGKSSILVSLIPDSSPGREAAFSEEAVR